MWHHLCELFVMVIRASMWLFASMALSSCGPRSAQVVEPRDPVEVTAAPEDGVVNEEPIAARSGLAVVDEHKIVVPQKIYFEFQSAVIVERSYEVLDAVAQLLVDFPHILHVHVAGHTDDRGPSALSIDLSLHRARAVVSYLVSKGVAEERLSAGGYRALCPLDSTGAPEASQVNRRVEFTILETDRGRTGRGFACPAAVDAGLVPHDLREYLPERLGESSPTPPQL
jgi:outer membrane protein OmpA-like peptidoglycan-associated protein